MSDNNAKVFSATHKDGAVAHHVDLEDGNHVVGLGAIKVLIVPDGEYWFAQGLEIDYSAQGDSVQAAQANFEIGLEATIEDHLRVNGDIKRLLAPAPADVWKEMLGEASGSQYRYSCVASYEIEQLKPYRSVCFYQAEKAELACA